MKRELFSMLCADVKRQIKRRGAAERDVLTDFGAWRERRRAARRGR